MFIFRSFNVLAIVQSSINNYCYIIAHEKLIYLVQFVMLFQADIPLFGKCHVRFVLFLLSARLPDLSLLTFCCSSVEAACAAHPTADVFINFASFRRFAFRIFLSLES